MLDNREILRQELYWPARIIVEMDSPEDREALKTDAQEWLNRLVDLARKHGIAPDYQKHYEMH